MAIEKVKELSRLMRRRINWKHASHVFYAIEFSHYLVIHYFSPALKPIIVPKNTIYPFEN